MAAESALLYKDIACQGQKIMGISVFVAKNFAIL